MRRRRGMLLVTAGVLVTAMPTLAGCTADTPAADARHEQSFLSAEATTRPGDLAVLSGRADAAGVEGDQASRAGIVATFPAPTELGPVLLRCTGTDTMTFTVSWDAPATADSVTRSQASTLRVTCDGKSVGYPPTRGESATAVSVGAASTDGRGAWVAHVRSR